MTYRGMVRLLKAWGRKKNGVAKHMQTEPTPPNFNKKIKNKTNIKKKLKKFKKKKNRQYLQKKKKKTKKTNFFLPPLTKRE
ncbi:hypothetical protein [Lacticaseibacillus rhamnosus]|uniref:hypothetical protein n=1 Tax=Lacticaseibacillus rhamnosus TaxID=47715 RepID=UPI00157C8955|nr:hypothetical protein [Lacticaseibacillus rhamnosus]NUB72087.1 hypothetical protein [Lacticaseibacillus rhamnosus]